MISKKIVSLLMLLSTFAIISIGFSSWTITQQGILAIEEEIIIDNMASSTALVNNSYSDLRYYDTGFINDDNQIVNQGVISLDYTLNLEECVNDFSNFNSVAVNITLKYSDSNTDFNLINNYLSIDNGYVITTSNDYLVDDVENLNNHYSITIIFNNSLLNYNSENNKINFSIDFIFNYTGDNFENDVFKYLYDDNIGFILETSIEGKE